MYKINFFHDDCAAVTDSVVFCNFSMQNKSHNHFFQHDTDYTYDVAKITPNKYFLVFKTNGSISILVN